MAVRKQVPLYYKPKNMVPPNGWTSGAHAIVNVVKNERITLRAADTRDPAGRAVVIYFFLRNKQLLFILVLATDQGNNRAVRELWPI